jgi:hypothetical protein
MQTPDERPPGTDTRPARRRLVVAAGVTVAAAGAVVLHLVGVLPPG